ncbi:MAG: tail fiber domain-containing protein, partial [Bacteroidota bacterium]
TDGAFKLWLNGRDRLVMDSDGQLGIGIDQPERPIHLRATNAIFRIDRDRDDPGFAVVRYDQGFQNVWKSFYFYTRGFGPNNGKFIIADWQQNVAGPSTARLVIANGGNVGIGDFLFSNPSQKLTVAGNAQANAFFTPSDKRFKEAIQPISEVMANLENVNGVSYAFRKQEEALEKRNLPAGRSMGLLAQEVQQVYPELVAEDEEGYLSINYDGFIPVLIEAVKEQQGQINNQDELIKSQSDLIARQQARLKSQADRMSRLESQIQELLSSAPGNTISPNNAAQLYQNQPNPFGENTKISFFLPESTQEAVLLVYDLQGKQIKEIRIRQRGEGEVTLQSGSLEAGMYFYALVADGQEVDMKRMLIRE